VAGYQDRRGKGRHAVLYEQLPSCRWIIRKTFSPHWIFRTTCRRFILPERYFHAFLGEKLPDWKSAASLVRKIAENYKLPYYTLSPTYSVCKDDGYIAGEHFTCPKCGKPAEVYSRITGYYRPVQNWNDGKAQEYKNRTVYDIGKSMFKGGKAIVRMTEEDITAEPAEEESRYLFTTSTCPNCRAAKEMLKDENVRIIDAEENPDLAKKYGILQAPTLVVISEGEAQKYVNASNIRRYVDSLSRAN
jgi:thiol-disulfide isomerase/thioredoxin